MAPSDPEATESVIRALLPHTWHAFFGRFGRLTPIQRRAIPSIVHGRSVLVGAPTATGKTEAVLAPLAERLLSRSAPRGAVGLILISPTRALVNDLHRRLRRPLGEVGLSVGIKTGDAPGFDPARAPQVLITTPESLDSLLARHPAGLRRVQALVLDELHLLDRTIRGDQLRCLAARLIQVTAGPLQRCAASATVPAAERLARTWLGAESEWICDEQRGRPIEARLAPAGTLGEAASHVRRGFGTVGRKLLVFANSRSNVEALAALLRADPALRSRVHAHHGSLARGERLRVEHAFLHAPSAICVATMTLELGIDIGDVDLVVLLAPPPTVSSLLQRVGRGNRKRATTRVVGLYSGALERRRFEHLLLCAGAGRLFEEPVGFRPTVLPQQALGLAFQNRRGWVGAEALQARLPAGVTATWSRSDLQAILDGLQASGHLRAMDGGRFVPDVEAERLFERGRLHSLIEDAPETEVIDALTGRSVGRVRFGGREKAQLQSGGVSLALGGKRREVSHVRGDKVFVTSAEGTEEGRFIAREAPRYSAALARDLGRFLGLSAGEMRVEPAGAGRWQLAHFLGTVWGQVLDGLLRRAGLRKQSMPRGGAFFTLTAAEPPLEPGLGMGDETTIRRAVERVVTARQARLARLLGAGPFRGQVPPDLLGRWVLESVDAPRLAATLAAARVVRAPLLPDEAPDEDGD